MDVDEHSAMGVCGPDSALPFAEIFGPVSALPIEEESTVCSCVLRDLYSRWRFVHEAEAQEVIADVGPDFVDAREGTVGVACDGFGFGDAACECAPDIGVFVSS